VSTETGLSLSERFTSSTSRLGLYWSASVVRSMLAGTKCYTFVVLSWRPRSHITTKTMIAARTRHTTTIVIVTMTFLTETGLFSFPVSSGVNVSIGGGYTIGSFTVKFLQSVFIRMPPREKT